VANNVSRRVLVHNVDDGLTINWDSDYPAGVTVSSGVTVNGMLHVDADAAVPGLVLQEHLTLNRPGGGHVTLNAKFFDDVVNLMAGDAVIETIQLDNVEPGPILIGGGAMRPIDLATELHRLRAELQTLQERVATLEAK
jgi:hypothetical protein